MSAFTARCAQLAALLLCFQSSFSMAGTPNITSGFNLGATGPVISVPFHTSGTPYQVDEALVFSAVAGPMTKNFAAPTFESGERVVLAASQPAPFLVTENFSIVAQTQAAAVSDWHEIIMTPGWAWIRPGDPSFPTLFPLDTSLITRDGQPWASTNIGGATDATRIDVQFSAIDTNHVLDIHKALLWVGTPTKSIWGNDPGDTVIQVLEYPTPEPSSFVLAALAGAALLFVRKRLR
jgi:hypothetical protein